MRFLHTSDWHLGKLLMDRSRIDEQREVLAQIEKIADEQKVDAILIAGDIFDNGNPSASAVELFCDSIKRLSNNGSRLVVIIAGNHDKPERLTGLSPLAKSHAVVIVGLPNERILDGKYGQFDIKCPDNNVFRVEVNGEAVVFGCVPFASEKRLSEIVYDNFTEEGEDSLSYEKKMREIYNRVEKYFCHDTINILMSHIFTVGYVGDDSERSSQLGNSFLLSCDVFPSSADYIALGHVHKMQVVGGSNRRAYYSGAILAYHSDEGNKSKYVKIVDITSDGIRNIEDVRLDNPKPIYVLNCNGFLEARDICLEYSHEQCYIFLRIWMDEILTEERIRELNAIKPDILEILVHRISDAKSERENIHTEKKIDDLFKTFYQSVRNMEPDKEVMDIFYELIGEDDETD